MVVRRKGADATTTAVVVQPLGERLGLAQALQHSPTFAELLHHRALLEADRERLLQGNLAFRQRPEDTERLLEPHSRVLGRRPRSRRESGLPEIVDRRLPQLAPEGMMGETLDLSTETILSIVSRWCRRSPGLCPQLSAAPTAFT